MKKRRSILNNQKGSSLVEVIVSFVISLVAMGIFYGGYRMALSYFYDTKAINEKTEALLQVYYTDADAGVELGGEFTVVIPASNHDGSIMSTGDCRIGAGRKYTVHRIEKNGETLYYFEASNLP